MPNIPSAPTPPGGGFRQQRAAEMRAEQERAAGSQTGQEALSAVPLVSEPSDEQVPDDAEKPAEPVGTGPVGRGEHVVKQGDCISSIAKTNGYFWETIWNDSANAELREARKDPNVLFPGDRVTVPPLSRKEEPGETEMRHRFRRKGEPAKLRLRLMKPVEDDDEQREADTRSDDNYIEEDSDETQERTEPRANLAFVLMINGERIEGTTDADGRIEVPIPGNARSGKLILNPGTELQEEMTLQLGHIDPVSEIRGVKERLSNLGIDCGDDSDEITPDFEAALAGFQETHELPVTGRPDQATRDKLLELHGC